MPAGKVDVSQEGNTPVGINHMLLGNDTDNALYFVTNIYLFSGIDLENIVYYKDSTHYFVMTAKKQSLLDKGVIINVCTNTG